MLEDINKIPNKAIVIQSSNSELTYKLQSINKNIPNLIRTIHLTRELLFSVITFFLTLSVHYRGCIPRNDTQYNPTNHQQN